MVTKVPSHSVTFRNTMEILKVEPFVFQVGRFISYLGSRHGSSSAEAYLLELVNRTSQCCYYHTEHIVPSYSYLVSCLASRA